MIHLTQPRKTAPMYPRRQIEGVAPAFSQKPIIKQEGGGKVIVFECKIKAAPKPEITWFRDGLPVKQTKRSQVSYITLLNLT